MPRQTCNLLALACMALMALATVEAALNGCGEMFLRSDFAEIGISSRGYQNSDCAAPIDYHPREQYGNRLGFMYDRYEDGDWSTKVGDFSLPGTPEMRFGLTGATSGNTVVNGMNPGVGIPTKTASQETMADRIGVWVGEVAFLGTTLEVTKQWDGFTFAATGIYITVTVKNVGSARTSEGIIYFESHDPDNDVMEGGGFKTTNSVTSNGGTTSDGVPYWQATARGSISGADTAIYYTSYDPRSSVSSDPGFAPSSAFDIINGNKGTLNSDTSIGIAGTLGFLNPGESTSYSFYLGFGIPSVASVCITPPAITCPAAVSANTVSGTCSATVNYATPTATSCTGDSVATSLSSGPAQGSNQNAGSYSAVWSAGSLTCSIPITVVDNQDPSVSCPSSPISLTIVPGTCSSSAYDYASVISASDNCAIDNSRTSFTGPSRVAPIPLGSYTVTATVYDFTSRSASCSFTLIVSNSTGGIICDSDGDGIKDDVEGTVDTDKDGTPDYLDTDSDGDGIPDSVEGNIDTDKDGTPDYKDIDSDNDGILDSVEGNIDTDEDGIPDYKDIDSDNDGIPDSVEGNGDSDKDGTPDYLDTDSDGDGIPDSIEGDDDIDRDGIPNFQDTDSDGDGILDSVEGNGDSDKDGTPDYLDTDSDNDGIPDSVEGDDDTDEDGILDFRDLDSDGDGILDSVEGNIDTDKDGIPDFKDTDSDGDGILDSVEGDGDADHDGIPDYLDTDSDNDSIPDKIEGTADTDGDGIPDCFDIDSDGDGILDATEKDVDSDNDGIPDFRDLDSDNDGTPDLVESGSLNPNDRDHYTGVDTDKDGLVDEVDRTPTSFGGPAKYSLRDTDRDGTPDYIEVDSDNDGVFDAKEVSNLPPNYFDPSTGKVIGGDTDKDGITDSIDGCVCFGGLVPRKFNIMSPTNAVWLMYETKAISWKHNLYSDFSQLKVDFVNTKTGVRKTLKDHYPIGPNNFILQTFNFRLSGMNVGTYKVTFSVYTTSGAFIVDQFSSPPFVVKTGQSV